MKKINEFEQMHADYSKVNEGCIIYTSDFFSDEDDRDCATMICCFYIPDIKDWIIEATTGVVAEFSEGNWDLMYPESVGITTELYLAIIADCLEHTEEVKSNE